MKEVSAYHTISEVSQKLDLPPHVLRFWEKKFNDLKPRKGTGRRRFYSSDDIKKITLIKTLLYDRGFTITGAINYLNQNENHTNCNFKDNKKVLEILNNAMLSLNKVKNIIKSY
tara:strand:- start:1029 stop:1370 length:342 start_codon:yes stop_codon:yes gene_type:complete